MSVETLLSNPSLRDRLSAAADDAEARDPGSLRASTLRLLDAALRDRDVTARAREGHEYCDDMEVKALLRTRVAQREASANEHEQAGDLLAAQRERDEIAILNEFLPRTLEGSELDAVVREVVDDLQADRLADIGRCMSALKERFPDRIDPGVATKAVKAALR